MQIVLWQWNEYVWKQDILMAYLEEIFNTFIWVIEYDCPDCCHEISLINALSPGGGDFMITLNIWVLNLCYWLVYWTHHVKFRWWNKEKTCLTFIFSTFWACFQAERCLHSDHMYIYIYVVHTLLILCIPILKIIYSYSRFMLTWRISTFWLSRYVQTANLHSMKKWSCN